MAMNKIQDVKLETTATYQPLSDLNVRFWSQDKNTAELRFIITRNKFPLSLSKENVKVIIALESGTSFISSDDFIIDSEVEGVARYIIPTDFMRVASNVTGQVYVTTLDREEVIVERQFKFTVSDDLLSDYPSEDKLRYIKTFDDLRTEISSRVSKLESDMETMEDYVTQVQDTTQEGITALSTLIQQKQDAYNANHTAKMKELNDKGSEYSAKFDDDKVYMDDKFQAFQESVNGSGLITTGQTGNWQKYKLTDDDGFSIYLETIDFMNIENMIEKSGLYYVADSTNGIDGENSDGLLNAHFENEDNALIEFVPKGSSRIYYLQKSNGIWDTFTKVDRHTLGFKAESEAGAQNKSDIAFENAKTYVNNELSNRRKTLWSGNASEKDTIITLTDSYKDFTFLIFEYLTQAGIKSYPTMIPTTTTIIPIQDFNLSNSDGGAARFYEAGIYMRNATEFTITHNHTYVPETNTGVPNSNPIEIRKIVGVK